MVSLKRASFLLALLAAVVLSSGTAFAQIDSELTTCTATAVPPVVRAEGIAELVGDIVLSCLGGPTGVESFQTNITVALNVNITNDVREVGDDDVMDSVLIINENNSTGGFDKNPANFACAGQTNSDGGLNQCPQQATQASNVRIEFNGVVFPNPGFDDEITTVRISSIRANAAQLGVPQAATFPSTQITAFVSITGPTTIPVTNNVLNVAVPIVGLIVGDEDPIVGLQCVDDGEDADDKDGFEGTGDPDCFNGEPCTRITLQEGFPTAFKTLGIPTFQTTQTQWEEGYYPAGGADQGTRFVLRFWNVPDGVHVFVDGFVNDLATADCDFGAGVCGDGLEIVYIGDDPDGEDGDLPGTPSAEGIKEVDISGGFGAAVYEVVDGNPFLTEDIKVRIYVNWESDAENENPGTGTAQVTADFGPLSTNFEADEDDPEPRFIESDDDDRTFLNVVKCTSTILFPFVTNQAGFDTGIAISNTSLDWLGTTPQNGACTIHYHGSTTGGGALADDEQTSTVIAGGEQLIFTLSGGNPGQGIAGAPEFQGYIIAVCDFQFGHGYAFITDGFGGIPALAQGYLALILELSDEGIGSRGLTEGIESLGH